MRERKRDEETLSFFPLPEDRRSHAYFRCAALYGGFEIRTHAHADAGERVAVRQFLEETEVGGGVNAVRRDAHQAFDVEAVFAAAEL